MFSLAAPLIDRLPGVLTSDLPDAAELHLRRIELFVIPAIGVDTPGYRICMRLTTAHGYGWSESFIEKNEKPSDWVHWSSSLVYCVNNGIAVYDGSHPLDKRLKQMLHAALEGMRTGLYASAPGENQPSYPAEPPRETGLSAIQDASGDMANRLTGTAMAPGPTGACAENPVAVAWPETALPGSAGTALSHAGENASSASTGLTEAASMIAAAASSEGALDAGRKYGIRQHSEDVTLLARSECYISLF